MSGIDSSLKLYPAQQEPSDYVMKNDYTHRCLSLKATCRSCTPQFIS